jgi:hypothetical protein
MAKQVPVDFYNNPFSIALMKDFGDSTRGFHKLEGFKFGQNNFHLLNERQQFQSNVSRIQSRLGDTVTQIEMTRIFISRLPFSKYYLKSGISPLDYIQYHTDVMAHKVHTVLEIMRLLVNELYDLKIPEKDCSWLILCKHLKKTELPMRYLDQYFKTFTNLIDARHLSSHRGIINDSRKEQIEIDNMYYMYKWEATHGFEVSEELQQAFPKDYIEYEIRQYKKDRVKLIDQVLFANAAVLKDFFSSLYPQYQKRIATF